MDQSDEPEFCPDHGTPGDPLNAWPCPAAADGDPPGAETCPHLAEELLRRMAEVMAGNYWRYGRDDGGQRTMIEYRNHEPTGRARAVSLGSDEEE